MAVEGEPARVRRVVAITPGQGDLDPQLGPQMGLSKAERRLPGLARMRVLKSWLPEKLAGPPARSTNARQPPPRCGRTIL